MRKSRFTDEQVVGILKEHAAGGGTSAVCRRHGISEETLYRWKRKYDGLEGNEVKATYGAAQRGGTLVTEWPSHQELSHAIAL